jgi:5'-phosphate synthase pdxT subunit
MQTVGVLALQGAFALHRPHIEAAGARYLAVDSQRALDRCDALILPGGESGAMLKLLAVVPLQLPDFLAERPAWGICAGAILLARLVTGPAQPSLGLVDVAIARNAYGRQRDSRHILVGGYEVALIRAPRVTAVGARARVRAVYDGDPVWVEQGRLMLTTFHPETSAKTPSPWHLRLLTLAAGGQIGDLNVSRVGC